MSSYRHNVILRIFIFLMVLSISSCVKAKYPAPPYVPAVRSHPDEIDMYYNLGIAYSVLKQDKEAVEAFQKVVTYKPDDIDAQFRLGLLLYNLDQQDKAVEALKRAFRNDKIISSHTRLGIAHIILSRFSEAAEELQKAYDNDEPHPIFILVNLGNMLNNLNRIEEATSKYNLALQKNPKYSAEKYNIYYLLGVNYNILGRYQEAVDSFKKSITFNPEFVESYFNLVLLYYYKLKDYEAAEKQYILLKNKNSIMAEKLNNIMININSKRIP